MKKISSLLFVLVSSIFVLSAQNQSIATLSHDDDIKVFYGINALKEAHTAATHGDVITLSSGAFNAIDITKAITLRGAGMMYDSITNSLPTNIAGGFSISIEEKTEYRLTIEGILSRDEIYVYSLKNANFIKCQFYKISDYTNVGIKANFIHCYLKEFDFDNEETSINIINSFLNIDYPVSYLTLTNCIVSTRYLDYLSICNIINTIIFDSNSKGTGTIESSNSVCNSLVITATENDVFKYNNNVTNKQVKEFSSIFKTADLNNIKEETLFELTDEAKTKYLGTDNTEIGIYGGSFPFSQTPTNIQITKCNIASKSTADGKLSIDIEVKVAE